jgi:rhamnogalacturonyl hydrolase YesR
MIKQTLFLSMAFFNSQVQAQKIEREKVWKEAESQIEVLVKESKQNRVNQRIFPRTATPDSIKLVHSGDWTSGFFPGILWMMFEATGKAVWKEEAEEFTALMIKEPYNRNSHDVGFKVYDSYGHAYRLTKDTAYKRLIIDAAKTLASRFKPNVGAIRSWDFGRWQYPVIIDNMMNLELLFAATRLSGDSTFYRIAEQHAMTTLRNHFRPDFSSYHVVDYDTATGQVRGKSTHQGYADESSWARGQAWALYGYTMCYRETKNKTFLNQAKKVAGFILNNPALPADFIPYWDFNDPGRPDVPRDASAASITASALYELSKLAKDGKKYRGAADKIMRSLTHHYRAPTGTNHGFLLRHSTGHKPANGEVDVPLIYADYYYLEALQRMKK